ncbi:MAG: radical SAM protein [Ruminococcus sp.]|nr:radical SAM protein [Ruminococcus sp.]
MKGNVAVFIPHAGCPNDCSFCNQRTISGSIKPPTGGEVREILRGAYEICEKKGTLGDTEIAFFGGSFTAIDRGYMRELLETAGEFLQRDGHTGFRGIRISTRPDCIDEEVLGVLKRHGVTSVELGAQSMDEGVLAANMRGHGGEDVRNACRLIKWAGVELGVQMMVGLYGSNPEKELYTCDELIKCRPDTVRIYPVAVLRGTALEKLYAKGEYTLYPFEKCVEICAELARRFERAGVRIIRMGLHAEDGVGENSVAGFYHPAFGEVVSSYRIRETVRENLKEGVNVCEVGRRYASVLYGHKRCNGEYFEERYPGRVRFGVNEDVTAGCVRVNGVEVKW